MAGPPPHENGGDGRNDGDGGSLRVPDALAAAPPSSAPPLPLSNDTVVGTDLGGDYTLYRSRHSKWKERRQQDSDGPRKKDPKPTQPQGPGPDGAGIAPPTANSTKPLAKTPFTPRERPRANARKHSQKLSADDRWKKWSEDDKRILQLGVCVHKNMPTDEVMELFARVQRAIRSLDSEEASTFARVYDRQNLEDCEALRATLKQWFTPTEVSATGISISEFKLRLREIGLLTQDMTPLVQTPMSWRVALLNSTDQADPTLPPQDADPAPDMSLHPTTVQLAHELLGPAAPLRSRLVLRAAIEERDHVRLIARLEGTMKLHSNVQRKGILRQLMNMTERLKVQNDEFKSTVLKAYYETSSNWVVFTFPSLDIAMRWLHVEIPLQGRIIPLQLPPTTSTNSDSALGQYPIQVFDTSSQLSALNMLYLFEDALGIRVKAVETAPPDVEGWTDSSSYVVTLAHRGCPAALQGRSCIVWNGTVVWVQHLLFANLPPCTQCADPDHTRARCRRDKLQPKYRLTVSSSMPSVLEEMTKEAPQRPEVFALWARTLVARAKQRVPLDPERLRQAEELQIVLKKRIICAQAAILPEFLALHLSYLPDEVPRERPIGAPMTYFVSCRRRFLDQRTAELRPSPQTTISRSLWPQWTLQYR